MAAGETSPFVQSVLKPPSVIQVRILDLSVTDQGLPTQCAGGAGGGSPGPKSKPALPAEGPHRERGSSAFTQSRKPLSPLNTPEYRQFAYFASRLTQFL